MTYPICAWFALALLAPQQPHEGPSAATPQSRVLHLRHGAFDPLRAEPDHSASVLPSTGALHIVQLEERVRDIHRAALERLGVDVLCYLPDDAWIVHMPAASLDAVVEADFVRWVGPFHPEYRLEPELLAALEAGALTIGAYDVRVFEAGPRQKAIVAEYVRALGGVVEHANSELRLMRVTVSPEVLATLVALDEVAWVNAWGPPGTDLNLAREFSGANYLEAQTGFTGQGVRGEVMDTGIDATHPDFQRAGGVLIHAGNSGAPGHGTEVTGAVFGDGTGNAAARGMCPSGKIVFASFLDVVDRAAHTAELVDPLDVYRCVFQTNSWGSLHATTYTAVSAEMDDMIFVNDLLILNSQGNTGNNLARPESWAKNVIGVGGVNHNNTVSTSDDFHCCSSTGPAADGRIKPDLVHFYDNVLTTAAGGGYAVVGGTSISTPITAGYFGLFFQMWHNDVFRNGPTGATVFESRPHFSLAKAAMINTARRWPFAGAAANLGRVRQGWGAVDARYLYDLREETFFVDHTDPVATLEAVTYEIDVESGEPELRVTLVWPEPAGLPGASKALVNDLDLKVTAPDRTTFYWGNAGLLVGNSSTPGGSPNVVDTVENVFVTAPEAGTWRVQVVGSNVTTDTAPATPGTDAVFSLWVTGGTERCSSSSAQNFCTAGTSASGCQAAVSTTGVASASRTSGFSLDVSGVEGGKDGQLFFGASGRQAAPWGNGSSFRCVAPPTARAGLLAAGGTNGSCDGSFSQDLNALWNSNPTKNPGVGATVQAQFWYRDPFSTSNQTTSFSDAIEFEICP